MIDGRSVLAVIPARGGSKGVPRKNVRLLGGKPLIAWTIEAAARSAHIDRMITTTEDAEILSVAREFGCEIPFVRPAELAADNTPGMAPIRHALNQLTGYDYVVVLQPTSPLRNTADIDGCISRCSELNADACVSMEVATTPPQWLYIKREGFFVESFLQGAQANVRRQEIPEVYGLNGAVYVARTRWIDSGHSFLDGKVACYEMPPERSLDVDTEWDWHVLSQIVAGPAFVSTVGTR
jgi:CMP-N,N'-diacetyllegionaminic acid synthase